MSRWRKEAAVSVITRDPATIRAGFPQEGKALAESSAGGSGGDADMDGAEASYRAMYEAYRRIFRRCGLQTKIVEADTGAMGGSASHEFMVLADSGEDGLVECDTCSYAANLERAESVLRAPPVFEGADHAIESVATPSLRSTTCCSSPHGRAGCARARRATRR